MSNAPNLDRVLTILRKGTDSALQPISRQTEGDQPVENLHHTDEK